MKKTENKKFLALATILAISSISFAYADDTTNSGNTLSDSGFISTYSGTTNLKDLRNIKKEELQKMSEQLKIEAAKKKEELKKIAEEKKAELDSKKEEIKKIAEEKKQEFDKKREEVKQFISSGSLTSEQKAQLEYLKKAMEDSIKTLRESITSTNSGEIMQKAQDLKTEYLKKIEDLKIPNGVNMIEERFKIFFDNNFNFKPQIKDLKDQREQIKSDSNKQKEQVKQEFKDKKADLKAKYKEQILKQISDTLDKKTTEQLNKILTNVNNAIARLEIQANNSTIREKNVAKLKALKEIIEEKLNPEDSQEIDINSFLE